MITNIVRSLSLVTFCAAVVQVVACAAPPELASGSDEAARDEGASGPAAEPAAAAPFAEITDDHGGAVQFFAEGAEIGIGVRVVYPNEPMIPAQFIERHRTQEVFVALAQEDAPLPLEMAARLQGGERERVSDPGLRRSLRSDLAAARAGSRASARLKAAPPPSNDLPLCSASFRSWVNDVYGGTECGLVNVLANSDSVSTTYCPSGCDADIYFFGSAGDCHSSLNGCGNPVFTGSATNVNGRRVENSTNYAFNHQGFRSHFAAANCAATVTPTALTFKRQYGSDPWTSKSVAVGEMFHYFSGRPMADQGAGYYGINYASYKDSAAEITHQMAIEQNTSSGDAGIFCADVLTDYSGSAPSCGGCNWCTASTPCNGCFSNCAGN